MPFQPEQLTESTLKGFVDRLLRFAKKTDTSWPPKRAWAQEAVAHALGFPNFHAAQAAIGRGKEDTTTILKREQAVPFLWLLYAPDGLLQTSFEDKADVSAKTLWVDRDIVAQHLLMLGNEKARFKAIHSLQRQAEREHQPLFWLQGSLAQSMPLEPWNHVFCVWRGSYDGGLSNLCAKGTAGDIADAVLARMDRLGDDNAMWRGRAISLLLAVVGALVALRDRDPESFTLTPLHVVERLDLDDIQRLSQQADLPSTVTQSLKAYLRSLPNYSDLAREPHDDAIALHCSLTRRIEGCLVLDKETPIKPGPIVGIRLRDDKEDNASLLGASLHSWIRTQKNGLLVLDGLTPTSNFYEWLLSNLWRLEEQGHAVIISARGLTDLPDGIQAKRILDRLGHWMVLRGTPHGGEDVRQLTMRNPTSTNTTLVVNNHHPGHGPGTERG